MYDAYCELKFIVLDGGILKEAAEKELKELEGKVMACDGKKPNTTRTCSKGLALVRLVKGVPVPDEIYKMYKDSPFFD